MNSYDDKLALFVLLGRSVEQVVQQHPDTVPPESLEISESVDLAANLPSEVKQVGLRTRTNSSSFLKTFCGGLCSTCFQKPHRRIGGTKFLLM
jgi:hypothetical protein